MGVLMKVSTPAVLGLVALTLASSGCSLALDTDKFKGEACESGEYTDLLFSVENAAEYENFDAYLWVVNGTAAEFVSVARFRGDEDLERESFDIFMPRGLAPGTNVVRFFFDVIPDGEFTPRSEGVDGDPGWELPTCSNDHVTLDVGNTETAADIDDPPMVLHDTDFSATLTNFGAHDNEMVEMRVYDEQDDRVVAYDRTPALHDIISYTIGFSQILEDGRNYRVDFYGDNNQNGRYDDSVPGADHTWRVELPDNDGNYTFTFVHNSGFTALDWEEP